MLQAAQAGAASPGLAGLAAPVLRQALIPMTAFYVILMTALGIGLLRLQRRGGAQVSPAAGQGGAPGQPSAPGEAGAPGERRGWPALARHALVTAVGGYLLILAVVFVYYYGVARVGGDFLASAATGFALLIALALPVFAALSWLAERRHRRPGAAPGGADGAGRIPRSGGSAG